MIRKLFLLILVSSIVFACSHKKDEISEQEALLLLLGLPDRAENYDRDVQIVTYNSVVPPSDGSTYVCNINYAANDVNHFQTLLQTQISQYPRGYLIKGKVERVILCANLSMNGRNAAGYADVLGNGVYLNVSPGIANGAMDDWINRAIHHEFTHNFDYAVRGFYMAVHSDWASLNTVGYASNVDWSLPNLLQIDNPVPGYITTYATSNVGEDYAEVGMGLMGPAASYTQMIDVCKTDSVVRAKVNLMISDMKRFWSFAVGSDTLWKQRVTGTSCN
ncbi:LIC13305 family lipoprotein [Leptospira sanjuanensis]|uniref:LIC13305 family lipoprotein n=1 Tax=Leptospira sanjuanensis TaxID=2879643 RepID=UPI001EE8DAB0|nr:putative zinc-binding metallopeptidase [Leptospira sanjuanensis]MCG6166832.1 putative zinc-binding metallopeptidase [Leptospira sanjuanensis]